MEPSYNLRLSCLLCLFVLSVSAAAQDVEKQVYIVYMGALREDAEFMPTAQHMNILQEITGESVVENRLVRSYKRSFNGFAAKLTKSEVERMTSMKGVVSIFPNVKFQLQTTGSWDFMGLKENTTKRVVSVESDTIIGVIDSGIWPESESFNDKGFGPPPKKWKGACNGGSNFTCNNKIVGARFYVEDSARDLNGHGTHTASTAAGISVSNVSFYGLGLGTARGGVPSARIAAYKVCDPDGCSSVALLSAFDDAIADGVDVITISIGSPRVQDIPRDPIAIGSFHAMTKGILTANSAGNSGPSLATVASVSPWILSVAASNTNRKFITKARLGDKTILSGRSLNTFDLKGNMYPLVFGKSTTSTCVEQSAWECSAACLDSELVKGKIVMCGNAESAIDVQNAGAIGAIVMNQRRVDVSSVYAFPVAALSSQNFDDLIAYYNSTKKPMATIMKAEEVRTNEGPVRVSFSSRGPNIIASDILKPDIAAPGVEILAAYSPEASPSPNPEDSRRVKYTVESGTSMACPHAAAAAAYVKTFHPDWSSSMIKSALMTTSRQMNSSVDGADWAHGSGHLDAIAAVHPGLVYESTKADHIAFLCGMNYTEEAISNMAGESITCTEKDRSTLTRNLNYPSMSAKVKWGKPYNVTFVRTLTNVGPPNVTYKAKVRRASGSSLVQVKVEPDVLTFKSNKEKKSFTVSVSGSIASTEPYAPLSLVWSDNVHTVRSPILIYHMPTPF